MICRVSIVEASHLCAGEVRVSRDPSSVSSNRRCGVLPCGCDSSRMLTSTPISANIEWNEWLVSSISFPS